MYRDGNLVEHTRTNTDNPGVADVTLIGREDGGRITALTRNGVVTRYGYDTAGQMVSATTTTATTSTVLTRGRPRRWWSGCTTPVGGCSAKPPPTGHGPTRTTPRGSFLLSRNLTGPGLSTCMTGWVGGCG